ncbi:MAG: hypothetical protein NWQ13_06575, partial [Glaciimonas sp.]|nr:hypothetical protein [Glaciimonas sp.]
MLIFLVMLIPAYAQIAQLPLLPLQSSALVYDSPKLNTESWVYQTSYSESDWSGHIRAFHVQADGSAGAQLWDAADLLP